MHLWAADVAQRLPSYEQLTWQINELNVAAWIIVFLGTTVVGALALVLNNSFGSFVDFMKCVAWGLELSDWRAGADGFVWIGGDVPWEYRS